MPEKSVETGSSGFLAQWLRKTFCQFVEARRVVLALAPLVSSCPVSSCAWLLWSPLGGLCRASGGSLEPLLGLPWEPLGVLWSSWAASGRFWAAPGLLLGRSWRLLGLSGAAPGPLLASVDLPFRLLGILLGSPGALLAARLAALAES